MQRAIYYKLQAIAARFALSFFSRFSFGKVRTIAVIAASIAWFFPSKSKKITLKNIELCFPELSLPEQRKLARKSLIESAKTAMEMPALYMWENEKVLRFVDRAENIELFENAIAKNMGAIILAPHHGNWEMLRHFLASRSRFLTLFQPLKSEELDKLVIELRAKAGVDVQPTTQHGIAKMFKDLRAGSVTAILPDSSPKSGAVFAPFFGVETYTATLLQKAAQKTRSAVICCAAIRTKNGFTIRFSEVGDDIYSENAREAATELNRAIEECVRTDPAQYFWEYRRFKIRPANEPSIY
ncbi:lipid A biosynthesis lauroyl acyltransferase [Campylobacterota bacterium]|nr:lipid A biosynthesis lauroyl acyltransferase [Campylobacterota bacterium]